MQRSVPNYCSTYILVTTVHVSYGPSFLPFALWPKREAQSTVLNEKKTLLRALKYTSLVSNGFGKQHFYLCGMVLKQCCLYCYEHSVKNHILAVIFEQLQIFIGCTVDFGPRNWFITACTVTVKYKCMLDVMYSFSNLLFRVKNLQTSSCLFMLIREKMSQMLWL